MLYNVEEISISLKVLLSSLILYYAQQPIMKYTLVLIATLATFTAAAPAAPPAPDLLGGIGGLLNGILKPVAGGAAAPKPSAPKAPSGGTSPSAPPAIAGATSAISPTPSDANTTEGADTGSNGSSETVDPASGSNSTQPSSGILGSDDIDIPSEVEDKVTYKLVFGTLSAVLDHIQVPGITRPPSTKGDLNIPCPTVCESAKSVSALCGSIPIPQLTIACTAASAALATPPGFASCAAVCRVAANFVDIDAILKNVKL